MYLLDYECVSSAGLGFESFMEGLYSSREHSTLVPANQFSRSLVEGGRICFLPHQDLKKRNYRETFETSFHQVMSLLKNRLTADQKIEMKNKKVLFILSSTKGSVEDYVWGENQAQFQDPFTSLYPGMKKEWPEAQILTVSNACSSSHIAVGLAQNYIDQNIFEYVFVVAFDLIGPFVYNGFQSLKVLSLTQNKPFSHDRDGLQLGEALAVALLAKEKSGATRCKVNKVASVVQPSSVTRPSLDGSALLGLMDQVVAVAQTAPSFFLAHGTGTVFNDLTENSALTQFQKKYNIHHPVTGTKWSIGHCLGASGLMDVIAASEVLRRKKMFSMASTQTLDKRFSDFYLTAGQSREESFTSAVVTSLGFGGVYAAMSLEVC